MKLITVRTEVAKFNRKTFFVDKDKNDYVKKMLIRVWEAAQMESKELTQKHDS